MDVVASLRKLGFRRWYERALIEAHLWLVTSFLALVLAFALFESRNETLQHALHLPLVVGAAFCVLGAWTAYRHYFRTLARAEMLGQAAACPQCGAYGRFEIVAAHEDDDGETTQITARCRKCRQNWQMGLQNHV